MRWSYNIATWFDPCTILSCRHESFLLRKRCYASFWSRKSLRLIQLNNLIQALSTLLIMIWMLFLHAWLFVYKRILDSIYWYHFTFKCSSLFGIQFCIIFVKKSVFCVSLFWSKVILFNLIVIVEYSWLISHWLIICPKLVLESELFLCNRLLITKPTILVLNISISTSPIRLIKRHSIWTWATYLWNSSFILWKFFSTPSHQGLWFFCESSVCSWYVAISES